MADREIKPERMRALTLWQPWAWAIPRFKDIENRPWAPPTWMLGRRFAIHAAKRVGTYEYESGVWNEWGEVGEPLPPIIHFDQLQRGAVTAVATLIGWCHMDENRLIGEPSARVEGIGNVDTRVARSNHSFGPYCWLLDYRIELPRPIPCRGYQKLWRLPEDVEAQVHEQVAEANRRL